MSNFKSENFYFVQDIQKDLQESTGRWRSSNFGTSTWPYRERFLLFVPKLYYVLARTFIDVQLSCPFAKHSMLRFWPFLSAKDNLKMLRNVQETVKNVDGMSMQAARNVGRLEKSMINGPKPLQIGVKSVWRMDTQDYSINMNIQHWIETYPHTYAHALTIECAEVPWNAYSLLFDRTLRAVRQETAPSLNRSRTRSRSRFACKFAKHNPRSNRNLTKE
jgi:hypothetical protein